MKLDPGQVRAIDRAAGFLADPHRQVMRVFGSAGTGKTSIAMRIAELAGSRVCFGAYTGKAASVLRRKGCENATTLHRLLYQPTGQKSGTRLTDLKVKLEEAEKHLRQDPGNRDVKREVDLLRYSVRREEREVGRPLFTLNPKPALLEADLFIVDEVSMVDRQMGEDILRVAKKVIVTGDPYQLPPIGDDVGFFTKDVTPDVLLETVHRQGADSPILDLATRIRRGYGFTVGDHGDTCRVLYSDDPRREALCLAADQMIVGTNEVRKAANEKHRAHRGLKGDLPVAGDRLIALKNNHDIGLLNGTMWEAESVDEPTDSHTRVAMWIKSLEEPGLRLPVEAWTAVFAGADPPRYTKQGDPESIYFGYAQTCHKAQGSEWPKGYVYDQSQCFKRDVRRAWLYTAVTRFSEDLTLVVPR
jgi:exodeoxyribonuclease-5